MTLSRRCFFPLLMLSLIVSLSALAIAQTQEVIYTNRVPVYVGDLINEVTATLDAQNASKLCVRLNAAIPLDQHEKPDEHASNCIFHIVRFDDFSSGTAPAAGKSSADVQTIPQAKNNWYVYSNDHFWSLEDLKQSKRLFGAAHVSFFFILINRALGPTASITNVSVSKNVLTIDAANNLKPGTSVRFSNVKTSTFLNDKVVTLDTAKATGFTAKFVNADVASTVDSGDVSVSIVPTDAPPSDEPGDSECTLPELPKTGADGYYTSYGVDVKRKVSANVEHLFALLKAEGLQSPTETADPSTLNSISPTTLTQSPANRLFAQTAVKADAQDNYSCSALSPKKMGSGWSQASKNCTPRNRLLAAKATSGSTKCHRPDAIFGGGTVDVAYRPSDISISGSLNKGDTTVAINKDAYVVDNEGRYYFDFSVPLTLKKLSAVQYQSTGGTFSPVTVASANAFMALDGFFRPVDVKSGNWPTWPHPLAGVAFAKQPLNKILVAGAWGPYFSEIYMGWAWIKQPRIADGSNSCKASAGTSATLPNSFGYHFCGQFSIGLNLSVTGIASKLGSPK